MSSLANLVKVDTIVMTMLLETCSNMVMTTSVQLATIAHQELGYLLNAWQVLILILVSATGLLL